MYAGNRHENVTETDLVQLFVLRTTNYLIDNCSIEMSNSQQNGRHNGHAFILASCHACDELVKLHSLEFHGHKLIIKEAKTAQRTLMTSKICIKCLPLLTTTDQDYQQHLQKNNDQFRTLTVHLLMQSYHRTKPLRSFWTVYLEG